MKYIKKRIKIYFIIIFILNLINDKSLKNNKIIVVVFAGRKRFLKILMNYLYKLQDNKKIDEIHFWQFTNDKNDSDYLEKISNIHKTSSKYLEYRTIYPLIENNSFTISINSTNGGGEILINNKYIVKIVIGNISNNMILLESTNTNITFFKELEYNYIDYELTIEIINYNLIINNKNKLLLYTNIDDSAFKIIQIRSLNNSDAFWDYKEYLNQGIKLFDSKFRCYSHWYEMYEFYLNYEFKILIKMDDDICFIDINGFDKFIKYINLFKKNITIPNMVNHAVSLYYNNKYGLIPDNILNEKYKNKNSSLDVFAYYTDGEQAKKIHQYFLQNIKHFTNIKIKPKKLDGESPSICTFGITKESYNKVYNPKAVYKNENLSNEYFFADEEYTYNLLNNYYYPGFVCVHYAFGSQRTSGLDEELLINYSKLSIN